MLTRVVMLDPFLSSVSNPMEAAWLKDSIGQEGNAKLYASVIRNIRRLEYPSNIFIQDMPIFWHQRGQRLNERNSGFIKIDTSF